MNKVAQFLIRSHGLDDSFYIASMKTLKLKIDEWKSLLPRIQPFYAIKCNPNKVIMQNMISNGLGFDCASKTEIETVLGIGASSKNIIFAHPVKKVSDLIYASKNGIKYTTFDSKSELDKLKRYAPDFKCIIRLKVDNPTARIQLGLKYGVTWDEYKGLIDYAKYLNLDIVGTSFHVGSDSKDPNVFANGVDFSKVVFDYAKSKGFMNMNVLDIGGGYCKDNFKETAHVLNASLDTHFPPHNNIKIIAEPGRYFAEETFTLCTPIIGQRYRDNVYEYWLSDGLYGSFNCILYDYQQPKYEVVRNPLLDKYIGDNTVKKSILNGITCDSFDTMGNALLPKIRNGDFIMCRNFGAYTIAGAMNFNGIEMSDLKTFYIED